MSSSTTLSLDSASSLPGINLKWVNANLAAIKEISLVYFQNTPDADIVSTEIASGLLRYNLSSGFSSGQSYSYQLQVIDMNGVMVYSNILLVTAPYFLDAPVVSSFSGGDSSLTIQLASTTNVLSSSSATVEFILKRSDNFMFWIIKPFASSGSYLLSSADNAGLTNNVSYRVACMYQRSAGNAYYSAPSAMSNSISATPTNLPDAPASCVSTSVGTTNLDILVSWSRPPDFDDWSAGGYSIILTLVGAGRPPVTLVNQDVLSYTWTVLNNKHSYLAWVQYVNNFGAGPALAASNGNLFPSCVPDPPNSFAVAVSDGQAVITWQPAFTGQTAITNYKVYINGNMVGILPPTALTYTRTGLSNGVSYDFNVTAVNAVGESIYSTTVSSVPFGAMSIVSVVAFGKTLTVTLNPNGKPITQVLLVALDADPDETIDGSFVMTIPQTQISQVANQNVTVIKTFSGFSSDIAFWCAIAHNATNSAFLKST